MRRIILTIIAVVLMFFGGQSVFAAETTNAYELQSVGAGGNLNVEECKNMLHEYAPIIWYSSLENIWPSSMEEMHECAKVSNGTVIYTKSWNKLRGTFSRAKNYAFFCQDDEDTMRLVYSQYYMTDPGKGMILSHYGDWEGLSIEFTKENGKWKPVLISYNHHGINTKTAWNSNTLQKSGNHPVVYAARGSHGIYLTAGVHRYKALLFDSTNRGKKWTTSNSLECYYYDYNNATELVSIEGADHVNEFTNINRWGQSFNSPDCTIIEDLIDWRDM